MRTANAVPAITHFSYLKPKALTRFDTLTNSLPPHPAHPQPRQESSSGAPSACAVCLVTPDGQRTMRTCLGASLELQTASQIGPDWCKGLNLLQNFSIESGDVTLACLVVVGVAITLSVVSSALATRRFLDV